MYEESIAIIILWALIFVYSILGSIDFGAGFGAWYTQNIRRSPLNLRIDTITNLGSNKYVSFSSLSHFSASFRKRPLLLRQ